MNNKKIILEHIQNEIAQLYQYDHIDPTFKRWKKVRKPHTLTSEQARLTQAGKPWKVDS